MTNKDYYRYAVKLYWSPFIIEGFDTLKAARAAAKKEKAGRSDNDIIIVKLNEYTGTVEKVLKA